MLANAEDVIDLTADKSDEDDGVPAGPGGVPAGPGEDSKVKATLPGAVDAAQKRVSEAAYF